MFIFGICLMLGMSVLESAQTASIIGFYFGIFFTVLMFIIQLVTDGEVRIKAGLGSLLGVAQIVLMSWMYKSVTDGDLFWIGSLICWDMLHTGFVRSLFDWKTND